MHFRKNGQSGTIVSEEALLRVRENCLIRHGFDPLYLFTAHFATKLMWSGFTHTR